MRLPHIPQTRRIMRQALLFSGLNRQPMIEDTELSEGKNLISNNLPAISPRKPHKSIQTVTAPKDLMITGNKLVHIDGTGFYYDGVNKGTVTAGLKSMVEFNGKVIIFPDKKYYDFITDTFGTFTCPYDIDYATVHYNRVFGIKGSEIFASKLGEFDVWEEYGGTELDSWATSVAGEGDFTGITTYQDHVVFFKRDQMYELYGYTPSQFRVLEVNKIGCIDSRSIAEVAGTLIFASENGIQTYSGGVPRLLSDKLDLKHVSEAIAGTDGRKYYVYVDGQCFAYDTAMGTWMPYMDDIPIRFASGDNALYFLDSEGIKEIEAGTGDIEWEMVTKEFDDGIFNQKSLKAIKLKLQMEEGSRVEVFVRLDGREWVQHKIIEQPLGSYTPHREVFTTIPMRRASRYQIKLTGTGEALVYGEREYYVGSERP